MKQTRKRLLACLLSLCLSVSLLPARAAEEAPSAQPATTEITAPAQEEAPPVQPEESPAPAEVFDLPEPAALAEYATLYAEDGQTVLDSCTVSALESGTGEVISFPVTPTEQTQLLSIQVSAADLDPAAENLAANNKITVRIDGTVAPDEPPTLEAAVSRLDDGTVSVAAIASGSGIEAVYIAGYDTDKRMVEMVTSGRDFLGGTLTDPTIVNVRVFGLDGNFNPVTDCKSYDI